jgi:hypothetical protein
MNTPNKKTPAKKTPAKKTPAKAKATAKKTPAKKTPAKKTPAKKTPAKAVADGGPKRQKPAGPYSEPVAPKTVAAPEPAEEKFETVETVLEKPSWMSRLVMRLKK